MAKTCGSEVKELSALNENAVLGWRFWAAFLGLGYLSGTMIIPNMKLRLEDILATTYTEKFRYDETILAQDFMLWLSTKLPEVEIESKLPLALSAGLRTLHELGPDVSSSQYYPTAADILHLQELFHPQRI